MKISAFVGLSVTHQETGETWDRGKLGHYDYFHELNFFDICNCASFAALTWYVAFYFWLAFNRLMILYLIGSLTLLTTELCCGKVKPSVSG